MRRVDSLEKTLMLGGIGGRRRRGWKRMRWLDVIGDSMDMSLGELRELVMDREAWRGVIHGVAKIQTRLSYWTELNAIVSAICDTHGWVCDDYNSLKPAFISSNRNYCFHGNQPHILWHPIQNCLCVHKETTAIKSLGTRSYTSSYNQIKNLFNIIEK